MEGLETSWEVTRQLEEQLGLGPLYILVGAT